MFGEPLFSPSRQAATVSQPWPLAMAEREHRKLLKQREVYRQRCVLKPSWHQHYRPSHTSAISSEFLSPGDLRLRKLEYMLDASGIKRTDDQILFHQPMVNALLPWLYDREWPSASARVMRDRGITTIEPLILTFAKRRVGKTWAVALLTICVTLLIMYFETTIFSTGGRISSKMMGAALVMANKIPGARQRMYLRGESLFVKPDDGKPTVGGQKMIPFQDGTSIINAYPSVGQPTEQPLR